MTTRSILYLTRSILYLLVLSLAIAVWWKRRKEAAQQVSAEPTDEGSTFLGEDD